VKLAIIGSGFAGLGMAIQLKKAGYDDFVILEKDSDLGGTWRDNRYPGCACDVPSHMYSFSYELNPDWSRMFAPQEEIWAYLRRCVAKYELSRHIRYDSAVEALEWEPDAGHWRVSLADGAELTPKAVVSGIGALHVPSMPAIPGASRFAGPVFHSAQWDHSCDLRGKRVAVIGTGASAIQFVPKVAEEASSLRVFQRTPPWIQPKPDFVIPPWARRAFRYVPGAQRLFRDAIYWVLETRAVGFTISPKLMAPQEKVARTHLARQVPDPELRAKVTPDYTIGCKRILLSSDYYPALSQPHVDVVTSGIAEITPTGLVTTDGEVHEVDVIIYGTGFKVTDALAEQRIIGRDGLKIQEAWAEGIEAHHGVTIAGFPNLFFLLGPNTGLGHNSVVFMIESQVQHVLSCLRLLEEEKANAIEVRPAAQRRFNKGLRRRLGKAVWNEGGCKSWYLDENGVNRTLWPGFTFEYWARTRRARRGDYTLS
jgi:cation diffusion facilitator CzcD-associated flavoprotein CzcO